MTGPKPLSNILEITPYKGGQKLDQGWKLSSNENALGCSPAALGARTWLSQQAQGQGQEQKLCRCARSRSVRH